MIPTALLRPIVDEWIAGFGVPGDAFEALSAATGMNADSWRKRLVDRGYETRNRSGNVSVTLGYWARETLDLAAADELLTAIGRSDLWHQAPLDEYAGGRALECEDCGKDILPGDYRPIDLMRVDPHSEAGVVWDATKRAWVKRKPIAARAGGRRFRRFDLCRRCAGEALRLRAARNAHIMENGVKRTLRTRERVAPRRGGRPRLLDDTTLRKLHHLYLHSTLSRRQIATQLAESGPGSMNGYDQGMRLGWRRLGLVESLGMSEGLRRAHLHNPAWAEKVREGIQRYNETRRAA